MHGIENAQNGGRSAGAPAFGARVLAYRVDL